MAHFSEITQDKNKKTPEMWRKRTSRRSTTGCLILLAGRCSVANFPVPKYCYFKPSASFARFKVSDATIRARSAPVDKIAFSTSGFLNC